MSAGSPLDSATSRPRETQHVFDSLDGARLFDLNIEEVLEHWEVEHALREIIANALDEQFLSDSDDMLFATLIIHAERATRDDYLSTFVYQAFDRSSDCSVICNVLR